MFVCGIYCYSNCLTNDSKIIYPVSTIYVIYSIFSIYSSGSTNSDFSTSRIGRILAVQSSREKNVEEDNDRK